MIVELTDLSDERQRQLIDMRQAFNACRSAARKEIIDSGEWHHNEIPAGRWQTGIWKPDRNGLATPRSRVAMSRALFSVRPRAA